MAAFEPGAGKRRIVDTQDFQAVILVGYGESLYPFNQGTNVLPKALMPVGNVPMINLVLDWVFAAGLTDVLILVPPGTRAVISEHLQQDFSTVSHPRAHIQLKSFTDAEDDEDEESQAPESSTLRQDNVGTARLLKRFRSYIKTDFVLLPCDVSFPSTLTLASILDKHRATPDAVLTSVFYEPVESVKESEDKLLVATDKQTNELLLVQDLESAEDDLELRMALLRAHPTLSLSTRLLDSHVYVFRRTVLELLATRRSKDLSSIKEQFVPWLVKGAWQEELGHTWATMLCPPKRDPLAAALARSTSTPYDQASILLPPSTPSSTASEPTTFLPTLSHGTTPGQSLAEFKAAVKNGKSRRSRQRHTPVGWTCRVIIAKPDESAAAAAAAAAEASKGGKGGKGGPKAPAGPEPEYLIRANSLAGYWEINRRMVKTIGGAAAAAASISGQPPHGPGHAHAHPHPHGAAGAVPLPTETAPPIAPSAQISPDSLLGTGVRVGDRASIKKCVVGRHCNIAKGAKLTNCVLWDWVTVEENARLENVIICGNGRVGEKAQIKDCELGPGFAALPGAVLKGERLIAGQEA